MAPKGRPQYRQIADELREEIKSGTYARGSALPTERDLAARYGVSTELVNRAIKVLRNEGLVRALHGRGVFVSLIPPITRRAASRYTTANREANGSRGAFDTELRALGYASRTEFTELGRTTDAPIRVLESLGLEEGDEVIIRARRMYADNTPLQIATSYLPVDIAGGTVIELQRDTGDGGTYSRLADGGHRVVRFRENVRTRPATDDEARFLDLDEDQQLYELFHLAYNAAGRVVEITVHMMPVHQWVLDFEWEADK